MLCEYHPRSSPIGHWTKKFTLSLLLNLCTKTFTHLELAPSDPCPWVFTFSVKLVPLSFTRSAIWSPLERLNPLLLWLWLLSWPVQRDAVGRFWQSEDLLPGFDDFPAAMSSVRKQAPASAPSSWPRRARNSGSERIDGRRAVWLRRKMSMIRSAWVKCNEPDVGKGYHSSALGEAQRPADWDSVGVLFALCRPKRLAERLRDIRKLPAEILVLLSTKSGLYETSS